jgi:uncharacterized coiled-coil DUF342 family protein
MNNEERILSLLENLISDVGELRQEVRELRQEVNELREEVNELREEVNELREDVNELREEVNELREDVNELKRRVTKIETTLENETNRNIRILAEGYAVHTEKLAQLTELTEQVHNLKIRSSLQEVAVKKLSKATR